MQMQFDDSVFSPSFSCHSSNNITSTAIAKVIREKEDFEFSFLLTDKELSLKDEVDGVMKAADEEIDASSAVTGSLGKVPAGTYCEWGPKADSTWKKSSSTGSGSKRWIFRYLMWRWNSEGKEPMKLLTPKKVDNPKQKRNSSEVSKAQTPVHKQFYVRRRAENEARKRKSYLPYRTDLVGLFANVNGRGKMLHF